MLVNFPYVSFSITGVIWLLYTVVITLIHYPRKKKFYLPLLFVFTMWFLAEPGMVLFTNMVVQPYKRLVYDQGCIIAIVVVTYIAACWKFNSSWEACCEMNDVIFCSILLPAFASFSLQSYALLAFNGCTDCQSMLKCIS